jgi:hypothetical protein
MRSIVPSAEQRYAVSAGTAPVVAPHSEERTPSRPVRVRTDAPYVSQDTKYSCHQVRAEVTYLMVYGLYGTAVTPANRNTVSFHALLRHFLQV